MMELTYTSDYGKVAMWMYNAMNGIPINQNTVKKIQR